MTRARRIAEGAAINCAAGEATQKATRIGKVKHPIGKLQHTRGLILVFLDTVGRPARTSEINKAVLCWYPEAAVYAAMCELHCAGRIKKLTHERDALFAIG